MKVTSNYIRLKTADLQPRENNPNQMSADDLAAYEREVKRLGKPPKPIIVRRLKNGKYEIVDGEHAWRCALAAGYEYVDCEVRDLDDYEASMECFKRNRGGSDNPVKLGRMFASMKKERRLSNRKLADELGISEGTVRVYLDYVEASKLRSDYAPDSFASEISELTQQQVRLYIELPDVVRDRWLDAGADSSIFDCLSGWTRDRLLCALKRFRLFVHLENSTVGFEDAVELRAGIASWLENNLHISDVQVYAAVVAELELPAEVMELLSLSKVGHETIVPIGVDAWRELLSQAKSKASKRSGLLAEIEAGVRLALRDAGIDPTDVCSRTDAEALRIVSDAPDYIQQADHLSLREKRWLAEIPVPEGNEIIPRALQMTCNLLLESRCEKGGRKKSQLSDSVSDVFRACLAQIKNDQQNEVMEQLFADTDQLSEKMLETLAQTAAIRDGLFGDQPASEVLAERLSSLELPEWRLIASLVLQPGAVEDAAARWRQGFDSSESTEDVA